MNQNIKLDFTTMKKEISKAGNLFYQYRPCRRAADTIYDIENIRHGVVYSQTPLNMNDPFDSMIGFSAEKIFDECISIVLDTLKINNEYYRTVVELLIKHKTLGKIAELFLFIKKLKAYLLSSKKKCIYVIYRWIYLLHKTLSLFIQKRLKKLKSSFQKKFLLLWHLS